MYDALTVYLTSLEAKGVKYFHIFSIDNILNLVADPLFVGVCISKNADCAAKVYFCAFFKRAFKLVFYCKK